MSQMGTYDLKIKIFIKTNTQNLSQCTSTNSNHQSIPQQTLVFQLFAEIPQNIGVTRIDFVYICQSYNALSKCTVSRNSNLSINTSF